MTSPDLPKSELPKLVRAYIKHVLIGFAASAVFVAMLLYFNVANLWYLVTHSADGVLAVFLLWLFNGIVFAGVQFSIAIMRMGDDDDDGPGGGLRAPVTEELVTIPVIADKSRRRL